MKSYKVVTGDIFSSGAEALVNPVNLLGIMGAGLALEFLRRYPECAPPYQQACAARTLSVGMICVAALQTRATANSPRYVVHFPTKDNWRKLSKLVWIESGLEALRAWVEQEKVASIALPALGCGLGGLSFDVVEPAIAKALGELSDCDVTVYAPA